MTFEQRKASSPELSQYEDAIRTFMKEYFDRIDKHEKLTYSLGDVDFSAPYSDDMSAARSGEYQIRDLQTTPTSDGSGRNFHFHIGKTEVHITGQAAARVAELADSTPEITQVALKS